MTIGIVAVAATIISVVEHFAEPLGTALRCLSTGGNALARISIPWLLRSNKVLRTPANLSPARDCHARLGVVILPLGLSV